MGTRRVSGQVYDIIALVVGVASNVPYAQSATKTDYYLVNTKISKINCEF